MKTNYYKIDDILNITNRYYKFNFSRRLYGINWYLFLRINKEIINNYYKHQFGLSIIYIGGRNEKQLLLIRKHINA